VPRRVPSATAQVPAWPGHPARRRGGARLSDAAALQPGSPGTVTPGMPLRQLQADEPVKQVAIAPQRVAQALSVNAVAIPLVAQPAFALLGAGH
jgi:hypothetical protein